MMPAEQKRPLTTRSDSIYSDEGRISGSGACPIRNNVFSKVSELCTFDTSNYNWSEFEKFQKNVENVHPDTPPKILPATVPTPHIEHTPREILKRQCPSMFPICFSLHRGLLRIFLFTNGRDLGRRACHQVLKKSASVHFYIFFKYIFFGKKMY